MSHQDKITVALRIVGLYFFWQVINLMVSVLLMYPILQRESQTDSFLSLFSGGMTSGIYLLQMVGPLLVQGFLTIILLTQARKIAIYLTRDIASVAPSKATNDSNSEATTIKVIGLVLFVLALKDVGGSLPTLLTYLDIENPFRSSLLMVVILQVLFPLLMVLKSKVISRFINRFDK